MHILKPNGRVIQRTTVGPLTPAEMYSDVYKLQMHNFMHAVYSGPLVVAMMDDKSKDTWDHPYITPTYMPYANDIRGAEPTMPEGDNFTMDAFNKYISAQLDLPQQDSARLDDKCYRHYKKT
jgi:hypothetical protein